MMAIKMFNRAHETALKKNMIEETGETRYWFTKHFLNSYELEVDSLLENPKTSNKSNEELSNLAMVSAVLRHMGPKGIEQDHLVEVVHLVKTMRDF